MVGLRKNQALSCFYCGRKSRFRWDGQISCFHCAFCDATNYLDKKGAITDPPAAATAMKPEDVQYARPRSPSPLVGSPRPSSSSSIFCNTCLKNQALFAACLAQYFPDDATDSEYAELERGYGAFRRGLEKRYPQSCAECEPKVLRQLDQVNYTAQADHLRRMIAQSKQARSPKQRTWLDVVNSAGLAMWYAGLVLQFLWHGSVVLAAVEKQAEVGDGARLYELIHLFGTALRPLPQPHKLISWSWTATALSFWWNPYFVSTIRGFTRHLKGFSIWYSIQAMVLACRVALWKLAAPAADSQNYQALFALHLVASIATLAAFIRARSCIRTEDSVLFGRKKRLLQSTAAAASSQAAAAPPPAAARPSEMNMSDILDEILATPQRQKAPKTTALSHTPRRYPAPSSPFPAAGNRDPMAMVSLADSLSPLGPSHATTKTPLIPPASQGEGSLVLIERDNYAPDHYPDEMEWTPTQSQHRAFATYGLGGGAQGGGGGGGGFGRAAVDARPFWYRVPPQPTNPAQQARNPLNTPRIRASPTDVSRGGLLFGGGEAKTPTGRPAGVKQNGAANGKTKTTTRSAAAADDKGGGNDGDDGLGAVFAQPRFFAENAVAVPQNDPRNSLSDMFSQSFTLGGDGDSAGRPAGGAGSKARNGGAPTGRRRRRRSGEGRRSGLLRRAQLALLCAVLAAWVYLVVQLGLDTPSSPPPSASSFSPSTTPFPIPLAVDVDLAGVSQEPRKPAGGRRDPSSFGSDAQLALVAATAILAACAALETWADAAAVVAPRLLVLAVGAAEAVAATHVGLQLWPATSLAGWWGGPSGVGAADGACGAGCLAQGLWLITAVVAHGAWNVFWSDA